MLFDWVEYAAFAATLCLSALIGVYFGVVKGGQATVDDYLLGGKKMGLLPISSSLICSFVSVVTVLGGAAELYVYGCQYLLALVSMGISATILAFVLLPVFYNLHVLCLYQYLEMRFNARVRRVVSFLYLVYQLLYIPIVMYGPALVLNQVSGVPIYLVTVGVAVVCIFYTTLGGLRAVCWTDLLQGVIMALGVVLVAVIGTRSVGGLDTVIKAAQESGRLDMFDFSVDPRKRTTFWSVIVGLTTIYLSLMGTNPSIIMKLTALPTLKKAQWSLLHWYIGAVFFTFMVAFMGLIAYARYKDCDPLLSGQILRSDQILPYFVVDVMGDVRGLPGIFIAGIVSAALSTMSSGINTISGTVYSDLVEPFLGPVTNKCRYIKCIAVIFGAVCLGLVALVKNLGAILEMTFALGGISTSITFGVFILGIFFPHCNNTGATVGPIAGLLFMSWIVTGNFAAIGSGEIVYETKPFQTTNCSYDLIFNRTKPEAKFGEAFPLFEVSFYYYSLLGASCVIVVGLVVSYITGPNRPENVKRELLSSLIHPLLQKYSALPSKDTDIQL